MILPRQVTLLNILPESKLRKMFAFAQNQQESLTTRTQPAAPLQMLQMSNIENCSRKTLLYSTMKTKELTAKQVLSVPCPTCGAVTGDACEPHALRTELDRERKLSAFEAVQTVQHRRKPG
jgi:hypothetical protein